MQLSEATLFTRQPPACEHEVVLLQQALGLENDRAINACVGYQSLPLLRDIHCEVVRPTSRKTIQNQSLTTSVLNPRSRELWRPTATENEFRVWAAASPCGGFCTKDRVYWAFVRAHKPAESVGLGRPGGGSSRLRTSLGRGYPVNREKNREIWQFRASVRLLASRKGRGSATS